MDQTSRTRRSLKRKQEREPESEDQNQACKVPVVEDPNKDVQSNSTTTSSMADLALPSSSESCWDYDVFLSFSGKDTRKNFTDHLYSALKQVGIRTFRDDEELPRGGNISTELLDAIRGSRILIVVFSKSYASSRWCLNELVEIMNGKKTRGQTLLPIFYHVSPSDVRNQTGPFAKAFSSHEARFHTDMERVEGWRVALTEAANCSGQDLDANAYESIIIQEIVKEVLYKVNPGHMDVAIHPVGLQSRVEEIKALLNLGTNKIRIVGFHGMAGIGKTTLAKAVYNEIYNLFEGSSFLSNVREISNESNGLVHLQEQLLDDILHKKNWNVYNVDRGISLIKERIQGKNVLIVVDDVDNLDQLHALVGNFKMFDSRSRLIATTRNEQLLNLLEVDEKYKVEELNHRESLQLFKWHAFKMTHPIKEHLELSVSVVEYTGGLPLALVVLGSSLFEKSVDEWKSKLDKLQKIPDGEIQKKLKISFDSLDDDEAKNIFLDIACFFIGMEKDYVIKILHACDFFAEDGLSILIQRSLVTIDDNKLRMHDMIRDMGRGIVLAESPNPGKRSRLWFYKDILNVLRKHMGSDTVKGVMLNLPVLEDLKTEGFTNMKNLRLLQINDVHIKGSYKYFSKELKWLCWHRCPLELLPDDFYLENLVILDMQQSNVKKVWEEKKNFNELKVLNLSNSKYLTTLPDFSQVPQLEILILEGCTSLVHVHESIGHLKRLVSLNLKNCRNLKDLPRSIFNLESLETLDLSGCLALKKLPELLSSPFGVLKNLKTLSLYGCSCLTELPNFLQAPHLKNLVLGGCTSLAKIHESIELLNKLVLLDLRRCESLRKLPSSISNLESLETLDLSGCLALQRLPTQLPYSFGLLKNLKTISLYGCSRLSALPNFLHATHLESLQLEGCISLVEIHESIGLLKRLVLLDLRRCENLRNLPSNISNLESLEILNLSGCLQLYKLPENLGNMTALWMLVADGTAIEQLPSSLGLLRNLRVLSLSGCGGPSSSWRSPKSSNHINLPPSISSLCSLRELNLSDRNLSEDDIPIEFRHLYSLKILDLSRNNFRYLPICISHLPQLQYLYLNECTTLQSISLPKSVQLFDANGCTSLERIKICTNEICSGSFYLDNCHKLVAIHCLKSLQPGSTIFMGMCNNLAYDFRKSVFQMVCKTDGDCSFCLPGSKIPLWVSHRKTGSLISFCVPSFLDGQIGKLLICVVYGVNKEAPKLSHRDGLFKLTFCNKSFRDPHKSYWRTYFDIFEDHICAQVMQFNQIGLEMNSGDEIELSIDLLIDGRPMEGHQHSIEVKECGIHLLPSWISSKSSDHIIQSNSTTRSTSSSSQSSWDHDVFLSFRGKDICKNFIDHLYTNLERVGIRTFRDDEGLRRGKTISTELVNAIRGSRISIVVFSEGYASSKWCLNEVAEIVDCKNTIDHTLLPIFYHVDTSDVRNQEGAFKEAFLRHEKRFQTDMKRVHRWREALTEAANCSDWDLESVANGYELRFIKRIVEEVLCKVNPTCLDVAKHPIGMESRVDHIKDLLNLGTSDVRIVGIYGMGGIGKTTLAKAVYNEICVAFEGSSFLSDLKESSKKPNGLVHLQEQLLNDILKTNLKISNVNRGISIIEQRIHGKKVLVILDDVDDFENLDSLVEKQWFGPGSRIIVTTTNERLLNQLEVDERYKVTELYLWESLRLFSWHAFKMANPIEGYLELSNEAVNYAGGLPLALVVLGSLFKGKSIADWKSELEKLRRTPHEKIQKVLEMSYDSLNNYTKEIFLDIACFFVGMDKEYAIKILDDFKIPSKMGIDNLIEKSLVTIGYQNELKMHNLIQDMGREIVCKESPKYLGKRSRLWFHEDVLNVLRKHTGSETVEGLVLNLPKVEDVDLETNAFKKMTKLRLLQINDVHFTGSYEHLSKELKWLCWHKCPQKSLPLDFYLEDLVILDMQHSKVKQVWKTTKIFNKLKVLNLSNSIYLTRLPDFSQVPQLEILILEGCTNLKDLPNFLESSHLENLNLEGCTSLIEIHESIGLLKRLVLLNLRKCKNLRNLSPSISKIKSLKTLVLSECFKLKKVLKQLENMTVLTELYLEKTAIKELPSSFSLLENLETLSLRGCKCLIKSPEFSQTSRLKCLELEGCTSLVEIHESIGFLKGLGSLNLDGCQELKNLPSYMSDLKIEALSLRGCSKLQKLPEEFGHKTALRKLQRLSLDECTTLQSISLPVSVKELSANGCTSLETVLILKNKGTSRLFNLNNCYRPVEIQSLKSSKFGLLVGMGGCITLADDFRYSIFQVLSLSLGSVCLPGSEIPNWIMHQTIGSSLSFHVPPSLDGKTGKVLVCMVYAPTPAYMEGPRETHHGGLFCWTFYKIGQCCYSVVGWSVKDSFGDHICAQVMRLGSIGNELKSGDEIDLSVNVQYKELFEVKKCGIHFLVDEPNVRDEDESDFDTSTDDDEV